MPTASLQNGKTPLQLNKYPGYDTKLHLMVRLQSLSFEKYEVSLHCHYSQVHSDPRVVVLVRVLSMDQSNHLLYLKPFNCVQTTDKYLIELLVFNSNTWKHLTVCRQMISIKLDRDIWYLELLMLDRNTWNYLTVCQQLSSGSFRNNVTNKLFI